MRQVTGATCVKQIVLKRTVARSRASVVLGVLRPATIEVWIITEADRSATTILLLTTTKRFALILFPIP